MYSAHIFGDFKGKYNHNFLNNNLYYTIFNKLYNYLIIR